MVEGLPSETPQTLRLKAGEFLRFAAEARVPAVAVELRTLATRYLERAAELERVAAARHSGNP